MINKHLASLALDEIKQLKMTTHNQRRNWNIYKVGGRITLYLNENEDSPFTNSCLFTLDRLSLLLLLRRKETSSSAVQKHHSKVYKNLSPPPCILFCLVSTILNIFVCFLFCLLITLHCSTTQSWRALNGFLRTNPTFSG